MQPPKKNLTITDYIGNDEGQQLIHAVKQGNQEALARLYDQYGAILFGFINRIVNDPPIAESVLQNTFIVIWKSIATYDPEKERILTWMLKITMSIAIGALPEMESVKEETNVEPSDIKTLNNVITLIFFKGLSLEDAAKKLDIPLNLLMPKMKKIFKQPDGGQVQ